MTGGAVRIHPGRVQGSVAAPPSKSATHRAYLLAAQSDQPATVAGPLRAADPDATLAGLVALGARADAGPGAVRFDPAPLRVPSRALGCANSGTTLRLLAATAARLAAPVALTGDASLRRRPNGPILDALRALGAEVHSDGGRAPLSVRGPIRPGAVELPAGSSSQFASALLLSLPLLPNDSTVTLRHPIASRPYLDLTLHMARRAGLPFEAEEGAGATRILVAGGRSPRPGAVRVEGDWSAAAFPLAAAAVTGGTVTVTGLDPESVQGDRAVVDLLRRFGCAVRVRGGAATATGGPLAAPGTIDVAATPDLFPALAAVAAASRGTTAFTGGGQLRAKESDRIAAMATGLRAMGIRCDERPDGLVVHGGRLRAATIASAGDHRIHMALAVAALAADGPSVLDGAETVAVSHPTFHRDLAALGARIEATASASSSPSAPSRSPEATA